MASLRKKTIGFSFGSHTIMHGLFTLKSNFDPRSSSLSLASLHSTCTRENSLERATQSCPTSPTKVPLPLDSPLLSKVRLRCSVSTNVLANKACQEKHRRCCRVLWIRRYNVCEASNENSEELEASELRGRELIVILRSNGLIQPSHHSALLVLRYLLIDTICISQ